MLSHLTAIVTFILAVGVILASAFAAMQLGSNKTVTADNEALRAGRQDDKDRIAERDLEIQTLRKEKAEQQGQINVLKEINSGIVNWSAVTDQVAHHHKRAEERWKDEDKRWDNIVRLMTKAVNNLGSPQ